MARVKVFNKTLVAKQVLRSLVKLIKENAKHLDDWEVVIESYKNGRENGYKVKFFAPYSDAQGGIDAMQARSLGVAFCECRGSDQILVYYFEYGGDAWHDDNLSDFEYGQKKYFEPGEYDKTAEFAFGYLTTHV